jgi:thiol-disulfide isomerase/thioredoxin
MSLISQFKVKYFSFFSILLFILLQGCVYRVDRVNIDGYLKGYPRSYIFISKFDGKNLTLIDSSRTNSEGYFKIRLNAENPYFVTIGLDKTNTPIILLVQPGEEINIQNENIDLSDYGVSGSKGSALLRSLTLRFKITKSRIDSLQTLYKSNLNNPKIDSLKILFENEYQTLIANHRNYSEGLIKDNTFSLVSILALFQAYDSTHQVFDYAKDRKYFREIDSSLLSVYSSNSMVRSFHTRIQKMEEHLKLSSKRDFMFKEGQVLPNIGYPLTTGENLFISGIWFKYILIDFWGSWCTKCPMNNAQLREIYKEYAPKGLVVLQVSVGISNDSLKSMVVRDSLTWYNACVPDMYNSKLLDTLKITSVPSNYITDRWGNVKALNLSGNNLRSKLKELFPK